VSKGERTEGSAVRRVTREPATHLLPDQEGTVEQTTEPIDEVIGQVERFYQSLTGHDAPRPRETPYAPIPPEKEPERHLAEQVDRLLASLDQLSPRALVTSVWVPPLALWETAGETWICLDLPGVTREAVQVRVLGRGLLEITGERRTPRFDGEGRRLHDESPRGPFRRVVSLPPRAAIEQMEAHVRDGALEIRIPRTSAPDPEVRVVPVT
jgi:HSP20 family protein